ncbi:MAG: hypothetical protein JST35_00065 [Armatimonadetes bacterium]|nr:hypothetical protein [Armatimonadota bacterium]
MSSTRYVTWAVGYGLILCGGVGAGCKPSPAPAKTTNYYSGRFEVAVEGQVVSIEQLAQKGQKVNQEFPGLSKRLRFVADYTVHLKGGSMVVEFKNGTCSTDNSSDMDLTIQFAVTEGKLRDVKSFAQNVSSGRDYDWVIRAFLSYWRPDITLGKTTQFELEGKNVVEFSQSKPGIVTQKWLDVQPMTANLLKMPNREPIPIRSEVTGGIDFEVTPDLKVKSAEGLKITNSFLGSQSVGQSRLDFAFSVGPGQPFEEKQLGKTVPFYENADERLNERRLQMATLKGATLDQLLTRGAKVEHDVKARNQVFLQLRALFFLDEEVCDQVVDVLKTRRVSKDVRSLVGEALSGAGTEWSQNTLAALVEATESRAEQMNLLPLFIPLTKLEKKSKELLFGWASEQPPNERSRLAQLVIGSNCRRCLDGNPQQATEISKLLSVLLRGATTTDEKVNLLYAMGNAASADCVGAQIEQSKDPSPQVRAAAVHSFRLIPGYYLVTKRLKEMEKSEKDPEVLKKVREVLALKEP